MGDHWSGEQQAISVSISSSRLHHSSDSSPVQPSSSRFSLLLRDMAANDSKKGLVLSVWYPMDKKGPQALTGTELNAAVYRYLQESGFVHTAFNFFYEAGIGKGNIQELIPQGALIRIVQKGLQYIELEANSEIGSDDEHHFFETLDLMTNDLNELTKKITSSGKHSSVKNGKEQKIDSVETGRGQKIGSAETATTDRKQPMRKTKAAQNSKPNETATMQRAQPVNHVKAQNISSAETVQKTGSVENTTELGLHLSWIGRKPRLRKRKH